MQKIGQITHYFDKIAVGVLVVDEGQVKLGDKVQIGLEGDEATFVQTISSMQVDHQPVEVAKSGDEVGFKLDQPVKTPTPVFLVEK